MTPSQPSGSERPLHPPLPWLPSRQAGLERMTTFMPAAGSQYARLRNFDFGPSERTNVSLLSPWIRHGALREEEVLKTTLEQHTRQQASAFVQEVLWRGYFKGWLAHNPGIWPAFVDERTRLFRQMDADHALASEVARACSGQTGIACFDSWAKELLETGWLHNHARMWFASIWIFTLRLPWQLGADFFLRHLLDGDPASNTCSWRWVAGLHTPGKTYLARAENIEKYTAGRFRPYGELAETAEALTEPRLRVDKHEDGPDPSWPETGYTLLVTEDDLLAETLPVKSQPGEILLLDGPVPRSQWPLGHAITGFTKGLLADAAVRIKAHFRIEPVLVRPGDLAGRLASTAQRGRSAWIVTARLRDGPVRDLLKAQWPPGLRRTEIWRSFDAAVYPHASAGFFKLRKKMDHIVDAVLRDDPPPISFS